MYIVVWFYMSSLYQGYVCLFDNFVCITCVYPLSLPIVYIEQLVYMPWIFCLNKYSVISLRFIEMADPDAPKREVLRIDDMNSDSVEEEDCTFSMDTTDGRGRFTLV